MVRTTAWALALAGSLALHAGAGLAGVTPEEAAKLKTVLTPTGAERAGNQDGSIPAWTGGMMKPNEKFGTGSLDPWADDKPLFSITAANHQKYADKLTDGVKALFQKYPDYRIDVYKTHRPAAAPQKFYDNTFRNATEARLVEGGAGPQPQGAIGGVPFPIPKTGEEIIWNNKLGWRWGQSMSERARNFFVDANGGVVLLSDFENYFVAPTQIEGYPEQDLHFAVRSINAGPPIRAGEGIVVHYNIDESKTQSWVYLTGQRRVRKLPNPCCDTPVPFAGGMVTFDELDVLTGDTSRFNWSIVGKREIYIPYNSNRSLTPARAEDMIAGKIVNPDHVRWELHRVWVVDAALKEGKRHPSVRSRYYFDEDTWKAAMGERWDAQGQLSRVMTTGHFFIPENGVVFRTAFALYDLVRGSTYIGMVHAGAKEAVRLEKVLPFSNWAPDTLAGSGVR